LESSDARQNTFTQPSDRRSFTVNCCSGPSHRCLYFSFEDVSVVYKRRYLLRHVAIEVFLANGGNHLVIFDSPEIRDHIYNQLVK
jgi:hypothetical protein